MSQPSGAVAPARSREVRDWHARDVDEVVALLETDPRRGLDQGEAARRLERYGPNALPAPGGRPLWRVFVDQFLSLVVGLLAAAAAVSLVLGEAVEAAVIGVVILINALIGFLTEWGAARAISALQEQVVATARVVRDGAPRELAAAEIVPGDVVLLGEGDRVPADGRVVEAARLQVDEAALTGESQPVSKSTGPTADPDAPLAERRGMAHMGTTVAAGRGRLVVTATGPLTELGHIGRLIEGAGDRSTPLERRLDELGRALIGAVLGLCAVIVLIGLAWGHPFFVMLRVGITLAVAAVPEGLPAVATMTLALGMRRMARRRAIIRRLPAVETLGSVTVICTDKTGTLTRSEMTATVALAGDRRYAITGAGYGAEGEFRDDGRAIDPRSDEQLIEVLRIGALCNDAAIDRRDGRAAVLGDPTEGALLVAAAKAGLDPEALRRDWPRVAEVPFDSRAQRMITVHRAPGGGLRSCVKGAPAAVLAACRSERTPGGVAPLDDARRAQLLRLNRGLAGEALRVLALAGRGLDEDFDPDDAGEDLTYEGMIGMIDPLRDEARAAVATCRAAGIRTVMITGDQQLTAAEIGRQLGLDRDAEGRALESVHARDLDGLDADGWARVAGGAAVFARVSPEHKLRLVEALQGRGEVAAMTGDGVNDAPALKCSDIGIAMGIKGTEVAKETADMIVTDDNFATIVAAVAEGRVIYANILKSLQYLFSCNLAEVLVMFAAILVGWPIPLLPLQILWMNMVTDVLPALALAVEPAGPDIMRRPPRDPSERLLNRPFARLIVGQATVLAAAALGAFAFGLARHGAGPEGTSRAMTLAFMTLSLSQVVHAFNVRSRTLSALGSRAFANGWLWAAAAVCTLLQLAAVDLPMLRRVLRTVSPDAAGWAAIAVGSFLPLIVVEFHKALRRRRAQRPGHAAPAGG